MPHRCDFEMDDFHVLKCLTISLIDFLTRVIAQQGLDLYG